MERRLADAIEKMPAFPESVQKVLALAADPDCSPGDLVDIIRHDPIFTLKVLKVVNSPFIGLRQRIASIDQASVYLGVNTLKNLALGLASIGSLPRRNRAGYDMERFWMHSLAVGVAARLLAQRQQRPLPEQEDLFSAGLLHDIGKAVFALYLPEKYAPVQEHAKSCPVAQLLAEEQRVMGATHSQVGAQMASKWHLPAMLRDNIAEHHAVDAPRPHTVCVQAADMLVKRLGHHYVPELPPESAPAVEESFGMNLAELALSMDTFQETFEKARVFVEA